MKFFLSTALAVMAVLCTAQSEFAWAGDAGVNFESRRVLHKPSIREADVFWEKRIRRRVDTRELINAHFRYPKRPLIDILLHAISHENINAYADFSQETLAPINPDAIHAQLNTVDTVRIIDPVTQMDSIHVVPNEFDPASVTAYLIEEIWYFDKKYSTMRVQILGIAPVQKRSLGGLEFEMPMFWIPYQSCMSLLTKEAAYLPFEGKKLMSWYDVLEMRFFDGYVVKEENVYDRSLSDYLSGTDRLLEADRIDQGILNYYEDLWSR